MDGEERVLELAEPKVEMPMKASPSLVRPVATIEEALRDWHEYQALKTKLAGDGDYVDIQGKMHPTKQFANKLRHAFGLSTPIIKAEKETTDDGFTWHIWVRAIAPNGQYNDGDGHCSSGERNFSHLDHDVYATAVTRAKNRAILEMVGFGEVSKEEILDDGESARPKAQNGKKVTLIAFDGTKADLDRFTALTWFQKAKKAIGEKDYYEILGSFGFEKSDQVPFNRLAQVFAVMVECYKQKKQTK